MVAGTIVVKDSVSSISGLRGHLLNRNPSLITYTFSNQAIAKVSKNDLQAIEKLLERWSKIKIDQRELLLNQVTLNLVKILEVESPDKADKLDFLKDFLTAYYKGEYKQLG
jgi:hypothetical protein